MLTTVFESMKSTVAAVKDAGWRGFAVTEFPDLDAVLKHTADMEKVSYFQYQKVISYLGIAPEP